MSLQQAEQSAADGKYEVSFVETLEQHGVVMIATSSLRYFARLHGGRLQDAIIRIAGLYKTIAACARKVAIKSYAKHSSLA